MGAAVGELSSTSQVSNQESVVCVVCWVVVVVGSGVVVVVLVLVVTVVDMLALSLCSLRIRIKRIRIKRRRRIRSLGETVGGPLWILAELARTGIFFLSSMI